MLELQVQYQRYRLIPLAGAMRASQPHFFQGGHI